MKKLYGIMEDGEIIDTSTSPSLGSVELVPNYTWEKSDYTDEDRKNWIIADRLADLFGKLCDSTGMTQKALAEYCGKTPQTFCNYLKGKTPGPLSVWRLVEQRKL